MLRHTAGVCIFTQDANGGIFTLISSESGLFGTSNVGGMRSIVGRRVAVVYSTSLLQRFLNHGD